MVFGAGMLVAGACALHAAWREVVHHDGGLWAVIPAALLPGVAATLARRTGGRGRGG